MRLHRCNYRTRYNKKRTIHAWIKHYSYEVYFGDGYWLPSSSGYKDFDKYHRKDEKEGTLRKARLRFLPINVKAFVGYDCELRRFHVRGRSPKNWSLYRYMFGRARRYFNDKNVGKRRKLHRMKPVLPKKRQPFR